MRIDGKLWAIGAAIASCFTYDALAADNVVEGLLGAGFGASDGSLILVIVYLVWENRKILNEIKSRLERLEDGLRK